MSALLADGRLEAEFETLLDPGPLEGKWDRALEEFKRGLKLTPNHVCLRKNISRSIAQSILLREPKVC